MRARLHARSGSPRRRRRLSVGPGGSEVAGQRRVVEVDPWDAARDREVLHYAEAHPAHERAAAVIDRGRVAVHARGAPVVASGQEDEVLDGGPDAGPAVGEGDVDRVGEGGVELEAVVAQADDPA